MMTTNRQGAKHAVMPPRMPPKKKGCVVAVEDTRLAEMLERLKTTNAAKDAQIAAEDAAKKAEAARVGASEKAEEAAKAQEKATEQVSPRCSTAAAAMSAPCLLCACIRLPQTA